MTDPLAGQLRPTSLDDRRNRKRRSNQGETTVIPLDGPLVGQQFETSLRDAALGTVSFLLRADLPVGQRVRLETEREGRPVERTDAEVIRSRQLSIGRHEIVVEARRPQVAPRPSESQRRHERRKRLRGEP